MNAAPNDPAPTNIDHDSNLDALVAAATTVKNNLRLKYIPVVIRNENTAFELANSTKAGAVMLGDGAYWVVCLADAARLEKAGYEFAPRR